LTFDPDTDTNKFIIFQMPLPTVEGIGSDFLENSIFIDSWPTDSVLRKMGLKFELATANYKERKDMRISVFPCISVYFCISEIHGNTWKYMEIQ
jgi:hypothetical protein